MFAIRLFTLHYNAREAITLFDFVDLHEHSLDGFINVTFHYANMSMQYTVIFPGCKNDNFQMKNCNIFYIYAQNMDCGYTLEPAQ